MIKICKVKYWILAAAMALILPMMACDQGGQVQEYADEPMIEGLSPITEPLVVRTADGTNHAFDVELALTPAAQARGLMYRDSLPENGGMLFVFNRPVIRSFWMKNTYIPLDMLFIDSDGRIVNIHHNAIPHDLTSISSEQPALAVLELAGGTAERLGISAGDVIYHERFGNVLAE